jgi:hypothetical protein
MNSWSTKTLETPRFELRNVANAIEMAAFSSKMLQIAGKADKTGNQKIPRQKNNNSQNNSGPELKPRLQK